MRFHESAARLTTAAVCGMTDSVPHGGNELSHHVSTLSLYLNHKTILLCGRQMFQLQKTSQKANWSNESNSATHAWQTKSNTS